MANINKRVILESEGSFEFEIAKNLKEFIDNSYYFYHIYYLDDILRIEKQGYNTGCLDFREFDLTNLLENELIENEKKSAIMMAYAYTFQKTKDFISRVSVIKREKVADTHNGSSHAFYHDGTGKYPEYKIVSAIIKANPDLFIDKKNKLR